MKSKFHNIPTYNNINNKPTQYKNKDTQSKYHYLKIKYLYYLFTYTLSQNNNIKN